MKFDTLKIVKKLCALGERQFLAEQKAADLIIKELKKNNIKFQQQFYITKIPKVLKQELYADNKKIPALATSFKSGKITSKHNIISSLMTEDINLFQSNINFNPECEGISRPSYHFAPSLAVARGDVAKILNAKKIKGEVQVKAVNHRSQNILVGNLKNPQNILIGHYDSLSYGAIDNASGTAVKLALIIDRPELLENNLFVFGGNEELSFDVKPAYWGHGYRVFENKYLNLLNKCKKIYLIDGLGEDSTIIHQDIEIAYLAFPINNLKKLGKKIYLVYANLEKLYPVYHCDLDKPHLIKEKYLQNAYQKILKLL